MRATGAGQILRERYGNELRHNLIGNAKWQDQTLETGAWAASALIPFDSYGIAPAAFMQRGPAFGDQATATIRQ
jgi:hypothetical protein